MKVDQREDTKNPTEFKIVLDCEYGYLKFRVTREQITNKQVTHTKLSAHGWSMERKINTKYKWEIWNITEYIHI